MTLQTDFLKELDGRYRARHAPFRNRKDYETDIRPSTF